MKIKKYCGAILALAMISANAMAADVTVDGIQLSGNTVTVSGTASEAGGKVTMALRNSETHALMRIAHVNADDDKNFEIVFDMPEEFKGEVADGRYTVTVNLNNSGGEKDSEEFMYVRESVRASILELLKIGNPQMAVNMMKTVPVVADAFEVEGINGVRLMALADEEIVFVIESAVADKDLQNIDYPDIASDMNRYISLCELSGGKNISGNLEEINPVFEEKEYAELTDDEKEFVAKSVDKVVPFASFEDFNEEYEKISVLCKLNFARYSQLDGLMEKYGDIIGLDGCDAYEDYEKLSSTKKQQVQEGIVDELETKVYSFDKFIDILEDEVKAASKKTTTGGGGGGGGGSSAPSKNTYVDVEIPSNTVVRADIEEVEEKELFDDLESVSWAKEAILALSEKGIVSGRGNGKFDPNGTVTREEFVKMIVGAAGLYDSNAKCSFADVVPGSWYEAYVASAVNNGLVKGQGENVFGVGQPITRQDVCVIASSILSGEYAGELSFTDNDAVSDYAKESVRRLTGAGIVSGMGDGSFSPLSTCTRAQAAKIIYGILERR